MRVTKHTKILEVQDTVSKNIMLLSRTNKIGTVRTK